MDRFIEVFSKLVFTADNILDWIVANIDKPIGIIVGIVVLVLVFTVLRQWSTNLVVILGRFFTTRYDTPGRPLRVKSLGTRYLLANPRLSSFKLDKNKARDLFVSRRTRIW